MDNITAIIPAAGKGQRMKASVNKQFINLRDKPVLAHTLQVFDNHPLVSDIIVVTSEGEIDYCQREIVNKYNYQKKIKVVAGGKERQDSVYNGLKEIKESGLVIIHDGARPFLTSCMIEKVIEEAKRWGSAVIGMPVKDTIKVVDKENFVVDTPNRNSLWLVQTPQCFQGELLIKAHLEAQKHSFYGTDDAMLVEKIGHKVKMVLGSYENIKITTPEDILIGEEILKGRS